MSMRMPLVVLCVLAVALVASAEQGGGDQMMMPTPPKEMAKLDAMVGTWKGTGTIYAMESPMKFDTVIKGAKRFQGQYLVQEETLSTVMPPATTPMVVHEEMRVTWYDTTAKTYRITSYDETGTPMSGTCRFDGDKFIVEYESLPFDPGQKYRAIGTAQGKDKLVVVGESSSDNWKTTTKVFDCTYQRAGGM